MISIAMAVYYCWPRLRDLGSDFGAMGLGNMYGFSIYFGSILGSFDGFEIGVFVVRRKCDIGSSFLFVGDAKW